MKTSLFTFVRIKKMYQKNVYEVDQEPGGGELQIPGGVPAGGGMVKRHSLTLIGLRGRHRHRHSADAYVDLLTGIHCFQSTLLFMVCSLSIIIHRHLFLSMPCFTYNDFRFRYMKHNPLVAWLQTKNNFWKRDIPTNTGISLRRLFPTWALWNNLYHLSEKK